MKSYEKLIEFRTELWRLIEVHDPDSGLIVQELQAKAEQEVLNLLNVSSIEELSCPICKERLANETVSKDYVGVIRLDSEGLPWCKKCTDHHDSIDWDEV